MLSAGKGLVGIGVAVGLWEVLRLTLIPVSVAPDIGSIFSALASQLSHGAAAGQPGLWSSIGTTVESWAIGLGLATLIAVPLGAGIGLSRSVDALTSVVVDFVRPIPAVALIPLAIVEFALTVRMQVFMVTFASVWPMLFNTRHGVQSVDPLLVETARTMRMGRAAIVARVRLPAALPAVITGFRTAATIGILVALAAELIAGSPGLGYYIDQMQQGNDLAAAYGGIVVSGVFGYVVNGAILNLERQVVGWQRHVAEGSR